MVLDPDRVRAVLFDIDGTLADTDDALARRLAGFLQPLVRLRPDFNPLIFSRRLLLAVETPINTLYAWWDRLYLDELTAPLGKLLPRRAPRSSPPEPLVEGVRPMLETLHGRYKLGVVTARSRRQAQRFLEGSGLGDLFDVVVTTRSVRRAKPHPAPVLWASEQLRVEPMACLMVGDTTVDIRSARAAGAQAVAVLCGFGERQELERAGANLVLDSTADLLDQLR